MKSEDVEWGFTDLILDRSEFVANELQSSTCDYLNIITVTAK